MTQAQSMRGSHLPTADWTRQGAMEERQSLPMAELITLAEDAGIILAAEGDQLRVRGPRNVEALGRLLLSRKSEVMAALCGRSQTEAIPLSAHAGSEATPLSEVHASPSEEPSPQAICQEETSAPEAKAGTAQTLTWDADRAAAVVAEVEKQIDTALSARHIASNPARRKILANERAIVHRLAEQADGQLWTWPQALEILLARWKEWDTGRGV